MKEVKIGKDKISVALCTYNGEKFIREQLRSIVGQTILPWQIVVCDDQSTDRTMDIVREFADDYPSIRWMIIRNEVRLGVRRNFEKAIALAEGDYIAPSDQDDIWERNKLEILLHIMREKKVSLVHSNIRYVDVKGREMTERLDFPCSVPLATYLYGLNNVMGCTCLFCAFMKRSYYFLFRFIIITMINGWRLWLIITEVSIFVIINWFDIDNMRIM